MSEGPVVTAKSVKPRQPKAKQRAKTKYEEAGVPAEYLNDKGRFKGPGWDAKLKSKLINTALDDQAPKAERTKAERMLAKLGWSAHLEKSKAARQAKAAKPKVAAEEVPIVPSG